MNEDTILEDLAVRSEAELLTIRDQAREVVYGHAQTISGLSQSVTWNTESAGMVLRLVNQVIKGRAAGAAGATDPLSLRSPLGHAVRFSGRVIAAP